MIKGQIVTLQPATQHDKRTIYEWLIQWIPLFPQHPLYSWEEFCDDYKAFFFDGSKIKVGRCFIITVDNTPVGQINYHTLHPHYKHTELDIWMKNDDCCGKKYGPDALKTLCKYLFKELGIEEFIIRPTAQNKRAIIAYQKSGFQQIEYSLEEQALRYGAPDCEDCIVLIKRFKGKE